MRIIAVASMFALASSNNTTAAPEEFAPVLVEFGGNLPSPIEFESDDDSEPDSETVDILNTGMIVYDSEDDTENALIYPEQGLVVVLSEGLSNAEAETVVNSSLDLSFTGSVEFLNTSNDMSLGWTEDPIMFSS